MTPQEINQILVSMVETVATHLLPNGHKDGSSWCAGSTNGEEGQSLRVCLRGARTGVWRDFSSNEKGGDLLSLWQQSRGLTFIETLKEAKAFAGIDDTPPAFYAPKRKKKPVANPKYSKPADKIKEWFDDRCIMQKALDAYKVGQQGNTIVFPFFSPEEKLELVKYRDLDTEEQTGKKKIWSNSDPEYHLWGWQAISDDTREVVICEGEIDALSWFQQRVPALSVPHGGGDGDKQNVWIDNDYERLQRFETIFVSMDMDAPGQSAIQPIISRLGVERCKIVNLGEFKDANEAHMNGIVLTSFLEKATTQDPEELKKLSDYNADIMDEFLNSDANGLLLPWRKTHGSLRIRPSEITVWAGINSHGKSIALSNFTVAAVAQGERICLASMEMKPRKLGRKMYQQIAGHNNPSQKESENIVAFLGDSVWLFEAYGTAKASRIIEVFSYARKRYGVTQFIVDSLAKCGLDEDDYNGQKKFVDELMEFAGEYNVHVHLVVHIRKMGDEGKIPGKFDVKGTGAITDMVDNVIIWWRNKQKEEDTDNGKTTATDNPDAVMNCVKQRETGEEPMVKLFFNKESCQFTDSLNDPPKQYLFNESQ
jgi:twinkle protein